MTAVYREDGHPLSSTDALGSTMAYERDARGRVLSITDPLGRTTKFERDLNGHTGAVAIAAVSAHVFSRLIPIEQLKRTLINTGESNG